MTTKENIGVGLMGVAWIALSLLGLAIHVWTIVLCYITKGIIMGVATLILPVISEVYWFFAIGLEYGFGTGYCVAIMSYIGLWGIVFLGSLIATD